MRALHNFVSEKGNRTMPGAQKCRGTLLLSHLLQLVVSPCRSR